MPNKKKTGLGRGLNTLIPTEKKLEKSVNNETSAVEEEVKLPINEIEPNPDQPRREFNEDALEELADSIKQFGILQPLIVQKREKFYEIIAGERRWRAAKLAGLKEVPVIIRDYKENEIVEIALIENIQRENLNPIEEAIAYQRLMKEFSLKQDQVALKVSKSRTAITNALRLLKLDSRVQEMLADDMISMGHARAILAITDENKQYEVALRVFDEKLSVRDIEKIVKDMKKIKKAPMQTTEDDQQKFLYTDIEETLKQVLGSKVSIKNNKKGNKGKIEIEYYSQDELERLIDMIKTL